MIEMLYANMAAYLLVLVRMAAMIAVNPLFTRRNVPMMVRTGLVALLTMILAPGAPTVSFVGWKTIDLIVAMGKELLVGFGCGFVFQVFYFMLIFAGDQMDVEFGLSMAKVFDPGTNIQMSISSNLLNLLFTLYLFATNSHLLLIRIFATSFQVVPVGGAVVGEELPMFLFQIFAVAFAMAVQLALPFIAAELILEISMGVLMKFIPQIHVFVINIQFKLLLGLSLLFILAPTISSFLSNLIDVMLQNMQQVLFTMV